jgi:hypothetical protein
LTLLNDNLINFNIPFINECPDNSTITININVFCDNTELHNDRYDIIRREITISDNIPIISQYESCQLFITLTSTNGISDSYNISIDIPQVIPTSTTSIAPSNPTASSSFSTPNTPTATSSLYYILAIGFLSSAVALLCIIVPVLCITIFIYIYRYRRARGDGNKETALGDSGNPLNAPTPISISYPQHEREQTNTISESESANYDDRPLLPHQMKTSTAPNERSVFADINTPPTRSLPSKTDSRRHSISDKKDIKTLELTDLSNSVREHKIVFPPESDSQTAPSLHQYISPGNNPVSDEDKSASVNDEQNESALSLSPGPGEIQNNMTKVTEQQ